jgi:hypothetical protein
MVAEHIRKVYALVKGPVVPPILEQRDELGQLVLQDNLQRELFVFAPS